MIAILLIAVIALMGYFGISLERDVAGNPTIQSNFSYVWNEIKFVWNNYLKEATGKLWRWAVINVNNLPLGSGNGVQVPQAGSQIDTLILFQ